MQLELNAAKLAARYFCPWAMLARNRNQSQLNTNKFVVASIITVAIGLLAGCGAQGEETHSSRISTPTETATVPATNAQACADFHEAHTELFRLLNGGASDLTAVQRQTAKQAAVTAMDRASLQGNGAVSERMNRAVSILPVDPTQMLLTDGWRTGEEFNAAITRVATACEAEGLQDVFPPIPLAPEMLRR